MKKFFVIALALALTAGAAYANYCARDIVPAATLLVPYAVVDMNGTTPDPDGYTTMLSVTNVSSEAQLIHVTVWSALSEPVVDFDEVLSGYDVWTINFRDMLTGHFDIFDTGSSLWGTHYKVTPFGPATNAGWSYEMPQAQDVDEGGVIAGNCYFPYDYHPEYGTGIVAGLRADIFPIWEQYYCSGIQNPEYEDNYVDWQLSIDPDDALFFYVTVDAVNLCSTNFPNSPAYWSTGDIPDDDNVLIGEVYYLNLTEHLSEILPAVPLEYDADAVYGPTFWKLATGEGYDLNDNPIDGLEPLGTAFAFRYYNSGGVSSNVMVWKNYEETYDGYYAFACGTYAYYAWDENEKSKTRSGGPSGFDRPEPNVIPFETQRVPMTSANWNGLMPGNGWMLLVFDPSLYNKGYDWGDYEAWVGVQHNFGGYSASVEAATMANYWCFPSQSVGGPFYLGVNFDYDAYWWD